MIHVPWQQQGSARPGGGAKLAGVVHAGPQSDMQLAADYGEHEEDDEEGEEGEDDDAGEFEVDYEEEEEEEDKGDEYMDEYVDEKGDEGGEFGSDDDEEDMDEERDEAGELDSDYEEEEDKDMDAERDEAGELDSGCEYEDEDMDEGKGVNMAPAIHQVAGELDSDREAEEEEDEDVDAERDEDGQFSSDDEEDDEDMGEEGDVNMAPAIHQVAQEGGEFGSDDEEDDEDMGEEGDVNMALAIRQVVQVLTLHSIRNFSRPWESGNRVESNSSGFVVEVSKNRRLIMTTVEVQRVANETKYEAKVVVVSSDTDIALLTVEDEDFWNGMLPVEFGPLPPLQSDIRATGFPLGGDSIGVTSGAVGFPLGGDSICVTSGVLSRVEVVEYTHSGRGLLAAQVDAPLNNGGWGSPIFDLNGRCIGMAFQKYSSQSWGERYDSYGGGASADTDDDGPGDDYGGGYWWGALGEASSGAGSGEGGYDDYDDDDGAENVGYAVPSLLLQSVLADFHKNGAYLEGTPVLGLRWQKMESPTLRACLGVHITGVDPTGSAVSCLQRGDVLLSIAGKNVAVDGNIELQPGQSVLFGHAVSSAMAGDVLAVQVLRQGKIWDQTIRLLINSPYVPISFGLRRPGPKTPLISSASLMPTYSPRVTHAHILPTCNASGCRVISPTLRSNSPYVRVSIGLRRPGPKTPLISSGSHMPTLRSNSPYVPVSIGLRRPGYIIIAGIVFSEFVEPFLNDFVLPKSGWSRSMRMQGCGQIEIWVKDWRHEAGNGGWETEGMGDHRWEMDHGMPSQEHAQVVLCLSLLKDVAAMEGYEELGNSPRRLMKVNGVKVLNLQHLARIVTFLCPTSAAKPTETAPAVPQSRETAPGASLAATSSSAPPNAATSSLPTTSVSSSTSPSSVPNDTSSAASPYGASSSPNPSSRCSSDSPSSESSSSPSPSSASSTSPSSSAASPFDPSSTIPASVLSPAAPLSTIPASDLSPADPYPTNTSPDPSSKTTSTTLHFLHGQSLPLPPLAPFLCFEFEDFSVVTLECSKVKKETVVAMQKHSMGHALSGELRELLQSNWPLDINKATERKQTRQQKRRMVVRR
eukprot:gene10087-7982_t